jgi:hypothetical protein
MAVPIGPIVPGAVCCHADNSDPKTVLDGAIHRQACQKMPVNRTTLRRFRRFVRQFLVKNFRPLKKEDVLTFEEFVESKRWTVEEKKQLREGRETSDKYGPGHLPEKYKAGKCFPKDEFYDSFKQSRGICGRHNAIKARYGPLVASVEKAVYHCKYFVKHMSPTERAKEIHARLSKSGRILENDYSTFEASFSPELMDACECQLMEYMLGDALPDEVLVELLDDMRALKNVMKYKWFTIIMNGTRRSGDFHTSLANGFTNLMVFLFVAETAGMEEGDFDILVEGDDSIAWLAFDKRFKFKSIAESLGFRVKQTWARVCNEGSFCQLKFHESGVVVRSPWKVITKLGWSKSTHVGFNANHLTDIYKAKLFSLSYECGDCPILWAVAKGCLEAVKDHVIDFEFVEKHLPLYERERLVLKESPLRPPSMDVRVFFEEMYRIPVSAQLELEKFFLSSPKSFDHPLIYDYLPTEWYTMWTHHIV